MNRFFCVLTLCLTTFGAWSRPVVCAETDTLKRAGALGAKLGPVSEKMRQERKLPSEVGTLVMEVLPNLTAAEGGIKADDVITAIDAKPVTGPGALVAAISTKRAGDVVKIAFDRDGESKELELTLKPRPQEKGNEAYDVVYGSVATPAGRLRTIVTRPKTEKDGPHKTYPAMMLLQGVGAYSVEFVQPNHPHAALIDHFARAGFVTMRIEKPGQGDSEGGPTGEVDFDTELAGYVAGLKALKGMDFVDAGNIVLFGHSMGGVMAPLMAAEEPVKGIAVYGTVLKTWPEYMMANVRRQAELGGEAASKIDEDLKKDAALNYFLYVEGKSPRAVAESHPELAGRLNAFFADGEHFVGRSHRFFRQLAAKNLPAAWEKFDGDVLAVWGKSDFVSDEEDHARIAEIANDFRPGHGKFVALENNDHGMNRAATRKESFDAQAKPGEYDPTFQNMLLEWAQKLTTQAK